MITYYQPTRALIDQEIVEKPIIGVEGGRFTSIYKDAKSAAHIDQERTPIIPFPDRLMIPGLVNSQSHPFHVLMRGFIDDLSFYAWRERGLYRLALTLSPLDIFHGTRQALAEMALSGITTVVDFFYLNHKGNDYARMVIEAAQSLGIRLVLARGMFDWKGGPSAFRESPALAVRNTLDLMDEFAEDPLIHVVPAPHSIYAASPEMLEAGAQIAAENHTRLFVHVAASELEHDICIQEHGRSPIAQLQHLGILTHRLSAIHATDLNLQEISLLKQAGAVIVHTPISQMAVGGGDFKLREMIDAGLRVALGTDSLASNNRASIFDEMRLSSLLQKARLGRGDATHAKEIWPLGTHNGGAATGLEVGSISAGNHADFNLLDLNDLALQPPQRLLHHLIYSNPERAVREVYIGGKIIVDNGKLVSVSEIELVQKSAEVTRHWR